MFKRFFGTKRTDDGPLDDEEIAAWPEGEVGDRAEDPRTRRWTGKRVAILLLSVFLLMMGFVSGIRGGWIANLPAIVFIFLGSFVGLMTVFVGRDWNERGLGKRLADAGRFVWPIFFPAAILAAQDSDEPDLDALPIRVWLPILLLVLLVAGVPLALMFMGVIP